MAPSFSVASEDAVRSSSALNVVAHRDPARLGRARASLARWTTGSPVPLVVMRARRRSSLMQSPRIAQQWERAVVLRLGRFVGPARARACSGSCRSSTRVSSWIDQRTITTSFAAEQTLTSDTVPVNVDAVLFWMVHDAQKAALEVQDYAQAVSWAAQTALRDIIGRTALDRSAARARADRGGAAAADRSALEPVGRHRVVGRDARRRHPGRAAGRDVARGAGRAREAGAHHPRPGRDGDRALVRGGGQVVPATTRPRCTCAR